MFISIAPLLNGHLFAQCTTKDSISTVREYFICKCLMYGFNDDSVFRTDHSLGLYLEKLGLDYAEKKSLDSVAMDIANKIPVSNYTNKRGVFASCFEYAEKEFGLTLRNINNDFFSKQKGFGNFTQELIIANNYQELIISYEFFSEPDALTIYDQAGKILYNSEMRSTKEAVSVNVPLLGVEKLVFRINTKLSKSRWRYEFSFK